MSLAEIKEAIDQLSDKEQLHLQRYLQDKSLHSEAWRQEISRRMREMDAGKGVTMEQLEALLEERPDE